MEPLVFYDEHVIKAKELFRKAGFDIGAMRYPRSNEALIALKRFNGLPDDMKVPFPWHFHPNEYCRDKWNNTGKL